MDAAAIINIVGEQVALGPLRRDLLPLYHRWRNDFYAMRTYGDTPRPETLEQRTAWYERASTGDEAIWFTIYEASTLRPIGVTDLFQIDWRHQTAQWGLMIGEADCRGKGYGTETARLMLDYAFTALGLHSVWLEVDEFNLAGRRAYEKAGFRPCGRRREATLMAGRRYDLIQMECLSSDFTSPVLSRIFAPDKPSATRRPPRPGLKPPG
jgi:RimJ/RimL family protein N-acetyltransferase